MLRLSFFQKKKYFHLQLYTITKKEMRNSGKPDTLQPDITSLLSKSDWNYVTSQMHGCSARNESESPERISRGFMALPFPAATETITILQDPVEMLYLTSFSFPFFVLASIGDASRKYRYKSGA